MHAYYCLKFNEKNTKKKIEKLCLLLFFIVKGLYRGRITVTDLVVYDNEASLSVDRYITRLKLNSCICIVVAPKK